MGLRGKVRRSEGTNSPGTKSASLIRLVKSKQSVFRSSLLLLTIHPNRNQSSAPKLEKRGIFSPSSQQGTTLLRISGNKFSRSTIPLSKKYKLLQSEQRFSMPRQFYSQPPKSVLLQRAPVSALSVSLGSLIML